MWVHRQPHSEATVWYRILSCLLEVPQILGRILSLFINIRAEIVLSVRVPANYGEGSEDWGGPGDWRCDADILDSLSH